MLEILFLEPQCVIQLLSKSILSKDVAPLTSCVTLGKSFNFSRPQFPHLKNGNGSRRKPNTWGYQGDEMTMHLRSSDS